MSNNVCNPINSEPIQPILFEQVQQDHPEACYQWVVDSESIAVANSDEQAQQRIDLLVNASNQNHAAASILLGQWHVLGHYVTQNLDAAILFFQHAAKLGAAIAHLELAYIGLNGLVEKINLEQALEHLQQAVTFNHPEAIHLYAKYLLKQEPETAQSLLMDNYLKHQYQESLKLLVQHEAFNQEQVKSQLEDMAQQDYFACAVLAFHFLKHGDEKLALKYADLAQEQHEPYGCYIRALLEQKNPVGSAEIAHEFLLKAAKNGHIESIYLVAVELLKQSDIAQNSAARTELHQQAFGFMQQAALAGNRDAQYSFSQFLKQGIGTEKDLQQGLYWLKQAAQNHHCDAQFELAMLLPLQHEQHLPLLGTAAQNGHIQAMLCMAIHAQRQQKIEQALAWLHKAKAGNSPRACYLLAQIYRDGVGITADLPQSVEFLQQAADLGDIEAYFELFKAYKEGLGVRKNKSLAIKYLNLAKENQHIEAASIEF
ncbi:tetratricopeptide repeat protein [Acinetobacter sp. ANC 4648]|uniref:tetratricopeptide repeat protein n=1 Tax=Acinetobacter sp. ANC 4648 TaxID=1977875 RepID=UPI000A35862E|nr:tetratricopeptide repeat protein [Acinetobacter sp. ANC 4648]OTG80677.1 hypothetical protein B9T27_12455 [Acinetobacter sp. ANC 4648]